MLYCCHKTISNCVDPLLAAAARMRLECSAGGSGAPQPQQKHTETLGRSSLELSTAVVLVCMVAGGEDVVMGEQ